MSDHPAKTVILGLGAWAFAAAVAGIALALDAEKQCRIDEAFDRGEAMANDDKSMERFYRELSQRRIGDGFPK